MIQLALTLVAILLTYFLLYCWIRPIRIINKYMANLQQRGYKVLKVPFNPFRSDLLDSRRSGTSQGDSLKVYKQERSNYDVVISNVFTNPRIQINHPDFLKEYFSVDKHYDFPKSLVVVKIFSRLSGFGLPFSEDEAWRRKRNALNKVFNFDFIKSHSQKMARICEQSIKDQELQAGLNDSDTQVSYKIIDLTVKMFSGIMLEIFLGGGQQDKIGEQSAGSFIKSLMDELIQVSISPLNVILGPKFTKLGLTKPQRSLNKNLKIFQQWGLNFIRKKIGEAEENIFHGMQKQHQSLISYLVYENRKKQNEGEKIYSEKQIFEQFGAFFFAGTDTTANFTQMMIYLIVSHPEVELKVRKEIDLIKSDTDFIYQNLKKLTYIDMVQKQVTRFYGPANMLFPRVAKRDNYLNGLPIKKGTRLGVMSIGNHYNEKYFKDAKRFKPERWEQQAKNIAPFVLNGFSGGARTCIGKHLALLQSKIALIKIMKRYSKIRLGKNSFKMQSKFLYGPEDFISTLEIRKD